MVGDLDGLRPATDQVQDGRQVRRDPEEGIRVTQGARAALGLSKEVDGALRVAAPCHRDPERGRGMDLLCLCDRAAGPSDAQGLPRQTLRFGERPIQHLDLGQTGYHRRSLRRVPARHQLHRSTGRLGRVLRVPGGAEDVGEAVVQQTKADAITTWVKRSHRGFQVRGRSRPATHGECRLRGPDLQLRVDGTAFRATLRGRRPGRSLRDGQGTLKCREFIGRSMPFGRDGGGGDRGSPGHDRIVRPSPQLGEQGGRSRQRGGDRHAVTSPGDRQQVALDGSPDGLVAKDDRPFAFGHESVFDRLGQTSSDIRVEDAIAMPRPAGRPRRRPIGLSLEGFGDVGQLLGKQGKSRWCHEAQDATALRRASRNASHHEVIERSVE